jgi:hypothetical protein
MKPILTSGLLSVAAFLLAASSVNHGLVDSPLPVGPGLTLDESFNIQQGIYVFDAFCHHGPLLFSPAVGKQVFGSKKYFPDHPPLARCILGASHQMLGWLLPGAELSALNVPAARLGSCFVFAMTVLLLTEFARRHYDQRTALVAAIFLMLMPRVLGHARIAAQETGTTLAWLAAIAPLLSWWTSDKPPTTRQCLISGLLWGILLLTKVQGLLLPPLVLVWALWHYREQAIRPLVIWGSVGTIIFLIGWPWLWIDPLHNVIAYLGKTTDRPQVYVWYFGERYVDKLVPWHYPFVFLAITVPLYVLLGLALRLVKRMFDQVELLLAATAAWPLIVFALPGTPVYDGTRLFLVIMPAVALLAARGVVLALRSETGWAARRSARISVATVAVLMTWCAIPQAVGPRGLCEYNAVVAGPAGAAALGLEADYWASSLNGDFWKSVPENSTVLVAPVVHQFQLGDIQQLVPIVRQRNITLVPYQYNPEKQRGLTLLIHRLADLPPHLREVPDGATVVATAEYRGVTLARLIDTTNGTWERQPNWPGDKLPAE